MPSASPLLRWVCLACALWLAGCHSKQTAAPGSSNEIPRLRPLNVLVITVDTLRADHLHCYGYPNIETPALDALAQRGVLFENAVAQTPLTPPSHASIFTGQNPTVHNVRNTGGFVLQSSSHPLARILQEQGWDTAAFIGSAVLKKLFGFNNGFSVYDDEMPRPGKRNEFREDPERKASDTVDRAIAWLNNRPSGKPFFLWVHMYDPHLPYQPPAEFAQKYKGRPYDGEIAYADQQIARLFDAVGKKSPAGQTVTAVLADHGESLGEHGEHTHGVFLYDATLRIPFIMAGPGHPRRSACEATGPHHRLPSHSARSNGRPRAGLCRGREPGPRVLGEIRRDGYLVRGDAVPEDEYELVGTKGDPHESLEVHPGAASRALRPDLRPR